MGDKDFFSMKKVSKKDQNDYLSKKYVIKFPCCHTIYFEKYLFSKFIVMDLENNSLNFLKLIQERLYFSHC